MTRSHKILGFLLVTLFGIYGCAKGPTGSAGTEKNPSLEAKAQRLEEDFRAAAAARDQFRQKLLVAEEKQIQLQRQLDQDRIAASLERETLKTELKSRIAEREVLQTQYEGFRKNLKELIGQAESALSSPTIPLPPAVVGTQATPTTTGSALSN